MCVLHLRHIGFELDIITTLFVPEAQQFQGYLLIIKVK